MLKSWNFACIVKKAAICICETVICIMNKAAWVNLNVSYSVWEALNCGLDMGLGGKVVNMNVTQPEL